jgi:antitoxin MazE
MPVDTRIARWGNSLAVRIPRSVARDARLAEGDRVELDLHKDGGLVLRPARRRYDLNELVAGITARNRPGETDWGPDLGQESW